ncbi:MAG TPA: hypothetical protein VLK84_31920 [Longimicrobium sp.]|nr:hypothetical protein [Longimicrobium sp.]
MTDITDAEVVDLFGAKPGKPWFTTMEVTPNSELDHGNVVIKTFTRMRKDPMTLRMRFVEDEHMAMVIGQMVPILLKSHFASTNTLRAHYWRVFRRLSEGGYSPEISGCGKG